MSATKCNHKLAIEIGTYDSAIHWCPICGALQRGSRARWLRPQWAQERVAVGPTQEQLEDAEL